MTCKDEDSKTCVFKRNEEVTGFWVPRQLFSITQNTIYIKNFI